MRVMFDYLDNGTVLGHKVRCDFLCAELIGRGHQIVHTDPQWLVVDYPNGAPDHEIPVGAQRLVMGALPVEAEDWGWQPLHLPVPRLLYGLDFLILNPLIEDLQVELHDECDHDLLVAMGGSDPFHLTERVLKHLEYHELDWSITVVVGPNFRREVVLPERDGLRVLNAPMPSMLLREMGCHGMALTAWGNTTFEAIAMGCLTVPIVQSVDHADEAALLGVQYVTKRSVLNAFGILNAEPEMPELPLHGIEAVVNFMEDYCQ